MSKENRSCENCGRPMPRANYISFNGGMIVCNPCCSEWHELGEPKTIIEFHRAIYGRKDYQSDLIAKE